MAHIPMPIASHSRKVCQLYKKALRTLRDYNHFIVDYRYEAVVMRKRFDDNKNIADMRVAKQLLLEGEQEWEKQKHPQPIIFPNGPGGIAYERNFEFPDYLLDLWSPMEKARYPKFFAKREEMKKEYMEFYYQQYPEERPKAKDVEASHSKSNSNSCGH